MHRGVGENNESNSIVSRHVESLIKTRLTSLSNESLSSPCPAPDCLGWQVSKTHTKFQRSRLVCNFCDFTYCSSCRAPFHYNCGCKQVLRVAQRWADWLRTDREKYLRDVGVEAEKEVHGTPISSQASSRGRGISCEIMSFVSKMWSKS